MRSFDHLLIGIFVFCRASDTLQNLIKSTSNFFNVLKKSFVAFKLSLVHLNKIFNEL